MAGSTGTVRDASSHAYVNRGFRAAYLEQLEQSRAQIEPLTNALCMTVNSTTGIEEYDWFGDIPQLAEWVDERKFARLRADSFTVKNVHYVNGIAINANDLADDKTGRAVVRIRNLADAVWKKKKSLIETLINGGFATYTTYDDAYLFSAAHVNYEGGTAHDNLGSGAMTEANVMAAITKLNALKNDNGEPLNMDATHLIFEPSKQWVALDILRQRIQSTGEENTIAAYRPMQPLMLHGLTAGYWAVADLSKPVKPFVLQNRNGADGNFVMRDAPDSDNMFMRNEVQAGVDWRGAIACAFYQCIVGSPGS